MQSPPWYREPVMMLVVAILGATVVSGATILTLAIGNDDHLVISEQEYQKLRDDFRATTSRPQDDEH